MISLRLPELTRSANPHLRQALHLYQLGRFQWALDEFSRHPDLLRLDGANVLKAWAGRQLQPRRHGSFSLVWQVSPSTWEADWVRSLFAGSTTEDIVDLNHKVMRPGMVVVDNLLTAEKSEYYRAAFMAGHSVSLIHLSDEAIKDDLSCYDWCDKVFRTYWSPALAGFSDILTFPLGYKSGLASAAPPPPAAGRPYLWSFAGDASKSSRGDMLAALKAVPNGKLHLTSGFDAGDALPTDGYRDLLAKTVFTPCPAGFVNLESFRVWEALECGSIPIVETRPNYDYFGGLVGKNPLPHVQHWSEAPGLIGRIRDADGVGALQDECVAWWTHYKQELQTMISLELQGSSNTATE